MQCCVSTNILPSHVLGSSEQGAEGIRLYELRVQDLVESTFSCTSGGDLELHFATLRGRLEDIKYLVEKKLCNPMQKNRKEHSITTKLVLHVI